LNGLIQEAESLNMTVIVPLASKEFFQTTAFLNLEKSKL
jgi:hypothetical protein